MGSLLKSFFVLSATLVAVLTLTAAQKNGNDCDACMEERVFHTLHSSRYVCDSDIFWAEEDYEIQLDDGSVWLVTSIGPPQWTTGDIIAVRKLSPLEFHIVGCYILINLNTGEEAEARLLSRDQKTLEEWFLERDIPVSNCNACTEECAFRTLSNIQCVGDYSEDFCTWDWKIQLNDGTVWLITGREQLLWDIDDVIAIRQLPPSDFHEYFGYCMLINRDRGGAKRAHVLEGVSPFDPLPE